MSALSREALLARLAGADVPILLVDTCSILDIVRAPVRDQLRTHDIDAAHTLIGRAVGAPPTVTIVITEQIIREFRANIDAVETETHEALKKAAHRFAAILDRMQALSPDDRIPAATDLLSLGFPQRGRHLAEQIVQTSSVLSDHPDDLERAYHRVMLVTPPATKARQSIKDCRIIESYLRLAFTLRSSGFSRNIVFTTSNTRDYQQNHRTLHPALRVDFDSVSLEYAPNWSAARHEIDRHRTPSPAPNPAQDPAP